MTEACYFDAMSLKEVVRGVDQLSKKHAYPVVTIGNFDGVHLGHQAIIELTVQKARKHSGTAMAYTFRPHPQVALRSDANLEFLTTYEERLELLSGLGLDVIIEQPFTREFSTIEPERFFKKTLIEGLGAREIVVGYDFGFGQGRTGHLEELQKFCAEANVELTVVQPQKTADQVVSSSKIRQHLLAGDLPAANALLGRPFFYRNVVLRGDGRGRTIGFPTANLRPESKLILPYGVYASESVFKRTVYPSVTNVGVRPTVVADGGAPVLVESHLLDQTIDLYGSILEVRFLKHLRSEKKFTGLDELKAQISLDVQATKRWSPLFGSNTASR